MTDPTEFEYPDTAGYPDGMGFLDEGTATLLLEVSTVEEPSAESDVEVVVQHHADTGRYVAEVDGQEVGSIRVDETRDPAIVRSTAVSPLFRGRGIAAAMIADSLDDLRARGRRLVVECPVVSAYIANHPEYADLLA